MTAVSPLTAGVNRVVRFPGEAGVELAVLADQPVRVGDFCRVGDVVGTVEDIGNILFGTDDRNSVCK